MESVSASSEDAVAEFWYCWEKGLDYRSRRKGRRETGSKRKVKKGSVGRFLVGESETVVNSCRERSGAQMMHADQRRRSTNTRTLMELP